MSTSPPLTPPPPPPPPLPLPRTARGHRRTRRSRRKYRRSPNAGPWPAAFYAAFYTQVWCTYRAGFEAIRDLPPLSSLPSPLFFPNVLTPSSPSDSSGALAQSTGTESSGTVVSHAQTHVQTLTSPRMQHSPSQSDSSYSSATSSSRDESGRRHDNFSSIGARDQLLMAFNLPIGGVGIQRMPTLLKLYVLEREWWRRRKRKQTRTRERARKRALAGIERVFGYELLKLHGAWTARKAGRRSVVT
ncbi:hypothetical protein B0H13DRAFT_2681515 [Mycena leptocephala]|nr:hypothetical protein B0H13DRAFT_2681515 [Mycena leptocephala]